jgi:D-aspartate ligase
VSKVTRTDNLAVILGMFETGLAVGRSLARAGIRVVGLDSSRKVGFYSKYIQARICPHPLEQEEDFVTFLLRIADTEKVQPVLFITADEFLASVIKNRRDVEKHYLVNLPDPHVLECITDKYKQFQRARAAGIAVPETFLVHDMKQLLAVRDRIPLPAFIKGNEVTSWRRTIGVVRKGFVVSSTCELTETLSTIFELGIDPLIQEIIPGPDTNHFKACCYISQKDEPLLTFGLQKLRQQPVGFGFGCLVRSLKYPELLDVGRTFFERIGYRGVASAEFKLDERDGRLKLIELNPRYWQQNGLADECGMNFPLTEYLDVTGCEPQAMREYEPGVKWVNIYRDFESFREYRKRGELSLRQWLRSLKGRKVYSEIASDDVWPGLQGSLIESRYLAKRIWPLGRGDWYDRWFRERREKRPAVDREQIADSEAAPTDPVRATAGTTSV